RAQEQAGERRDDPILGARRLELELAQVPLVLPLLYLELERRPRASLLRRAFHFPELGERERTRFDLQPQMLVAPRLRVTLLADELLLQLQLLAFQAMHPLQGAAQLRLGVREGQALALARQASSE